MTMKTPPIISFAILAGIVAAVLIGTFAMAAVYATYDECGQICWQGLRLALRDRY
jgi:hypothetical protein